MKKEILESLRNELKQIKKEGKVDNINVEQLDVEEREIHDIKNRKMKKSTLKKGLVLGATAIALMTVPVMPVQVVPAGTVIQAQAAKKDKKKPTIKFSGSSKIKATKGKSVKIPKTTAKDNKDGNVTKKIKVAVKKGSKSYSSIAKKVKANKAVKFSEAGTYAITYTVKDKAGNKATKKRYVTVKKSANTPTLFTLTPTPTPDTPTTTEAPKTTEAPATTEASTTTETQTINENWKPIDLSDYNIEKKTVGSNTYNMTKDSKFKDDIIKNGSANNVGIITHYFENDYESFFISSDSNLQKESKYLEYFGKLIAYDKDGNDLSQNTVIYEENVENLGENQTGYIYVYTKISDGIDSYNVYHITRDKMCLADMTTERREILANNGLIFLSENPLVIAKPSSINNISKINNNSKSLLLNK